MNLTMHEMFDPPRTWWTLEFSDIDLYRAKFSVFDRAVIADTLEAADRTVADRLLGLELIARRVEEAQRATGDLADHVVPSSEG